MINDLQIQFNRQYMRSPKLGAYANAKKFAGLPS